MFILDHTHSFTDLAPIKLSSSWSNLKHSVYSKEFQTKVLVETLGTLAVNKQSIDSASVQQKQVFFAGSLDDKQAAFSPNHSTG